MGAQVSAPRQPWWASRLLTYGNLYLLLPVYSVAAKSQHQSAAFKDNAHRPRLPLSAAGEMERCRAKHDVVTRQSGEVGRERGEIASRPPGLFAHGRASESALALARLGYHDSPERPEREAKLLEAERAEKAHRSYPCQARSLFAKRLGGTAEAISAFSFTCLCLHLVCTCLT
jgi:hypothetical protein